MPSRDRTSKKKTPSRATSKKNGLDRKAGGVNASTEARKAKGRRAATAGKAAPKAPKAPNATEAGESTAKAEVSAAKEKALFATPVRARQSREERAWAEERVAEIDAVCNAWADIVAERISADQTFADLVEQLDAHKPRDLRGLFLWDALHAAESHVAMITEVIATHLEGRKADPIAILEDLRARQRQIAAVYSVNAFLAVLNQMKPTKPQWVSMDEVDPRFAVLALAHQTLSYATEAARVEAPLDLTDHILSATQDEAVWVWRRMPEPGTETLAACAATAAFFRGLGANVLTTTDEVAAHYAERSRMRDR